MYKGEQKMEEKKFNETKKFVFNYCMNELNFADPKWDDKNFPDYKETNDKDSSDKNKNK